ncbi:hypothetical protein HanLR1_Chr13g0484431 [Helianthus annuus]|nr:hypothetical protein HanLR1_Chr13g0484431 [Helianthus annuus]
MIGRVRSKSKSCAFSNSSAREGRGVAARVVAMVVAMGFGRGHDHVSHCG